MITASQCRAARALTDTSKAVLAEASGVRKGVISDFERKLARPDDATIEALERALESLGAVFVAEDDSFGLGVRMKFTRSEARRISSMENEGGPVLDDEIVQ